MFNFTFEKRYTYCPYFGETQPLVVGAAEVVEAFVVVALVAAEVVVTIVVAFEVVLAFEVVGPEEPLLEHPMRLEAMAMSSYQNVLVAEP